MLDVDAGIAVLTAAGAEPTNTPVVWLKEHRADRLSIPLAELGSPEDYLVRIGRTWLAMWPSLGLMIAGAALALHHLVFGLILVAGIVGLAALRVRYDRLLRRYRTARRRARLGTESERAMLDRAVRSAFRRRHVAQG